MNKKLQIFVSSTYSDLIDERQMIVQSILKFGSIPAGMELFTANSDEQFEIIKQWIDSSDVYLLLLGGRYGSICDKTKISYTEMEYDYAVKKKKPIIAIVLADEYLENKEESVRKSYEVKNQSYLSFKEKIMSKMVSIVKNKEDLCAMVLSSINAIQNDDKYHLTGWVRGDYLEISAKYRIGEFSFNEINEYLLSLHFESKDSEVVKYLSKFGDNGFDLYGALMDIGGKLQSNYSDAFSKFMWNKVVRKMVSIGLMEIKKQDKESYFISSFTNDGIKYNQLRLKFKTCDK